MWWNQQQQPSGDFHYLTEFTPDGGNYPTAQLRAGLLFTNTNTLTLYGWEGKLKWRRTWLDPTPNENPMEVWSDASQDGRTAAVVYREGDSLHLRAWQDDRETINRLIPIRYSTTLRVVIWHIGEILLTQEMGKEVQIWAVGEEGIRAKGVIQPSRHFTVDNYYYCFPTNDDHRFICFWQHNQQHDYDLVSLSTAGDRIITHTQQILQAKGEAIYEASLRNGAATSYDMSDADWTPPYPGNLGKGKQAPILMERNWADHGRYAIIRLLRSQTDQNIFQKIIHPGGLTDYQLFERPGRLRAQLGIPTHYPENPGVTIRVGWHYYNLIESYLSPDGKSLIVNAAFTQNKQVLTKYVVFHR